MTAEQFKRSKGIATVVAHQGVTMTGRHEIDFVRPTRTDEQEAFVRRESHPP
jgi:hypothetical protein